MDELVIKMRLLAKAELILLRLHFRRAAKQTGFYVVAGLLAVLAVGMLNVSLYLFLLPHFTGAVAALVVAGADIVLSFIVVLAAGRLDLGREAIEASALRELTMTELVSDVKRVNAQIADLSDDIKKIRSTITWFTSSGGFSLPSVLQWVPMLLGFFLRKKQ